jgi:hypothetical protein
MFGGFVVHLHINSQTKTPSTMTKNWIFTPYDEEDNEMESFTIRNRTEHEAKQEAMDYVERHQEIDNWSLLDIDPSKANKYPELPL